MENKQNLRKLIQEIMGKQVEIDELSTYLTNSLTDEIINKNYNKKIGWPALLAIAEGSSFLKETMKIERIVINCDMIVEEELKKEIVSGNFNPIDVKLSHNNLYSITIFVKIKIKLNSDILKLKNQIDSVISHELNHVYHYLKTMKTYPKTNVYNKINRELKFLYKNSSELKEFTKYFYLNLPQEIQARVQETANALKHIEETNINDTIKQLYKYQPINDAISMINYKGFDIKDIDLELLEQFVSNFNILAQKKGLYEKKFKTPESFFNYWFNYIPIGGNKLYKKILKLVGAKYNLTEMINIITELDEELKKDIINFD